MLRRPPRSTRTDTPFPYPTFFRSIAAIEGHHFPRLEAVYWREGSPDFASVAALIGSLDTRPDHIRLRAAAQALDLTLLKRLADEAWVRDREIGRASCRERVCQYV